MCITLVRFIQRTLKATTLTLSLSLSTPFRCHQAVEKHPHETGEYKTTLKQESVVAEGKAQQPHRMPVCVSSTADRPAVSAVHSYSRYPPPSGNHGGSNPSNRVSAVERENSTARSSTGKRGARGQRRIRDNLNQNNLYRARATV